MKQSFTFLILMFSISIFAQSKEHVGNYTNKLGGGESLKL
jgi:hypothetical protein